MATDSNQTKNELAWFCVRTQNRRESFAFDFLKRVDFLEAFWPRIRYCGVGRRKGQWITESLFPGYLFCKFDWRQHARDVTYSPGVSGLIHFGQHYPVIPAEAIRELQEAFGAEQVTNVDHPLKIGDRVLIESGPMRGTEGMVCRILPGRARVALLIEFLGIQTQVEINLDEVQTDRNHRADLFEKPEKTKA